MTCGIKQIVKRDGNVVAYDGNASPLPSSRRQPRSAAATAKKRTDSPYWSKKN